KQLRQRNRQPLPFTPADLDAVILTHAHIDHSGHVPVLVRDGFTGPVFATAATRALCRHLLPDSGFIQERDPDTVRGPDVGFWSITRQPQMPDNYFEIPPDLLVEVLSTDDRRRDVREKIRGYIGAGVPLVWLVDPDTRTVTVYAGSLRGLELDETDQLDGGAVLSGFSCHVSDLFG
ncbi:MAG: Uma2 family endonuclease, partial [Gemmataceae bacterium]